MMYDILVDMTESVVANMQRFIKTFGSTGLYKYKRESPESAKVVIIAVCRNLDEAGKLLDDSVDDILSGLCRCSHAEFKKTFEDVRSLRGQTLLGMGDIVGTTLERIEKIFDLASSKYNKFCLDNTWHVPMAKRGVHSCWNCGDEKHKLPDCPKPRNTTKIEENKKKFQEKNGNRQGGGHTYSRSKFGKPKPGENGVWQVNGMWYCHCAKCDEWNQSHTTGFHAAWSCNKTNFKLSAEHPYSLAVKGNVLRTSGNLTWPPTGKSSDNASTNGTSGLSSSSKHSTNLLADLTTKCEDLERNTDNPQLSQMAGLLKSLFTSLKD